MDEVIKLLVGLVTKVIELASAGDKEAERKALLAISSQVTDEAARRALGI